MVRAGENIIWQYWETHGDKPRFIDDLHEIAKRNSGVKIIQVTPETVRSYLPDIEDDVVRIADLAHKADIIRTRLVLRYGGMWLDSDAIVLKELSWLFEYLKDYDFVGFNNGGQLQLERPWVRINCFLSRPDGTVISEWVRLQREKIPKAVFDWSEIGSSLLNPICVDHRKLVNILPFEKICPVPWSEVEAFTRIDEQLAEHILHDCFVVMLSNRALRNRNAQLLKLSVEEIAAKEYLLAKILRAAKERRVGTR